MVRIIIIIAKNILYRKFFKFNSFPNFIFVFCSRYASDVFLHVAQPHAVYRDPIIVCNFPHTSVHFSYYQLVENADTADHTLFVLSLLQDGEEKGRKENAPESWKKQKPSTFRRKKQRLSKLVRIYSHNNNSGLYNLL